MNKKSKAKLMLSIIIIIVILSTSTAIFVIYYPKTKISSKQIEKKKSIKAKETEDQESSESTVVEETKEEVVKEVVGNTEDINSNVPTLDIQKFSEPKLESQTQNPIESIVNAQGSSVPALDIEGPVEPKSESQIQDQIETAETETADQASNVDLVNGQNEDQIQRDGEYSNDEPLNNKPEPRVVETKEKLELENKKLTEEKQNIVLEPCSLIVGSWGCTIRNYDKTLRLQEIETRKEEIKNRLQEIKEQVIIDTPSDTKSPISSSQLINVEGSSHDESEPTVEETKPMVEETESMVEEPESEIVVQEIQVQDRTPGNDEDNAEGVRKTTSNKDVSSDSSENDDSKNGEEPESEVVVPENQDQDESIESSNNEELLSETKPLVDRTTPNDGEDTENGQSGNDELRDDVSSGKTEPVIEESEPVIEESEPVIEESGPMVEESENEDSNNEELLSQTKSLIDSTTQSDGQDTVNSDSGDDISSSESEVKESESVIENTEVKDTEVEGSRELTMDEFLILIKTTPVNDFIRMFPPELIEDIEKLRSDLFILKTYGIGTIKLFIPPDFKENSHQLLELLKKKTAGEELEEVNYSCISYFKGLCYKWTTEPKTEEVTDSIGGYNNEEILPQTKPLVESTTPSSDEDTKNSKSRNDELGDDASSGEQTSKPVIEESESVIEELEPVIEESESVIEESESVVEESKPVVEESENEDSNNQEILQQTKSLVDSTTPSDDEDTENQEQENPYSEEEFLKVLGEYETSPKPFNEEQKEESETYLEKHGDFTVREFYSEEQRKELEEYLLKLIDYITLDGNISRKLPLIIKYFELLDSLYIVEPGIDEEPESVIEELEPVVKESEPVAEESKNEDSNNEEILSQTKPLVESTTPSDGEDTEDSGSRNDESVDDVSSHETEPEVEVVETKEKEELELELELELEDERLTEEKQNIILEPCGWFTGTIGCTIRNYDKTLRLQEIETRKEEIKNRLQEIKEQVIIDTSSDTQSSISLTQLTDVKGSSDDELEPVVEEKEDKSSNNEEILPQTKSLVDSTTPSDDEDTENQEQENPYSEEELEKVLGEYETSPKPFNEEQKEELETYLEKHGDFTAREFYNEEQRGELEEYLLKLIDYITSDDNISIKLPLIIKYFELLDSLYIVELGIDEEPESVFKEEKKDEIPINDDSTESKIISSESISKPTVEESESVIEETKPLVESTTPSDGEDTEDGESENDESGDGVSSDEQTSKPVVEEVESVVEDSEPAIEESEKENSNNEELLLETKPLVESTIPSGGEDTEDGESGNDESGDGISSLETEPVVEELEPVIEESENEEQDRTPTYDEEIIHVTYSTGEEEPKSIIIESQFQRIGVSTKTLVVNEEEHEETSSNPKIEPSSNIENTEEGIEVEGSGKLTVPSTLKVEEEINYDSEESEYQTIEDVEDQSKSDIQKEDGTTVERESEHSEEELTTQLQIPILLPLIDFQSDSESRKKRMNGVLRESIVNEGINIELKKREEDTRDYNFSKLKKIAVIQNKIRIKEEKIKRIITRIKELNRNKIISPKHNKKRMKKIIKKIKKIKRIRNKIKKLTKKIIKKLRKLRKRTRNQRTSQSIINY